MTENIHFIQQHRMYLDINDSLNLMSGEVFEPDEVALVKKNVFPGSVVIDIGANIGYYTLLFAKLVGAHGHVFAFEPEPANFLLLTKNILLNNYNNVTWVPKAVASSNKRMKLFLCDESSGMHRIYPSLVCDQSLSVDAVSLDTFSPLQHKKIDFIKMDIEGAEYMAMYGMQNIIKKNSPKLLTEFSPAALFESGTAPKKYLDLLLNCGYTIYDAQERPVNLVQLENDLILFEQAMQDIFPNLNDQSMPETILDLTSQLIQYGYNRPLVENFLCIIR